MDDLAFAKLLSAGFRFGLVDGNELGNGRGWTQLPNVPESDGFEIYGLDGNGVPDESAGPEQPTDRPVCVVRYLAACWEYRTVGDYETLAAALDAVATDLLERDNVTGELPGVRG